MEVYTIGFTRKSAEDFFTALKGAGVRRVLDVRLNNVSQLAGFTKRDDLRFFLKEICDAEYMHEFMLAPTAPLLKQYRHRASTWQEYERSFLELMALRGVEDKLDPGLFGLPTALLCSEPKADRCHRRLVLEYLESKWGDLKIVHL